METKLALSSKHSPQLELPSRETPDAFLSTSGTTTGSSVAPFSGLVLDWYGPEDEVRLQDSVNSLDLQDGAFDSWRELSDGDCSEGEYWGGEPEDVCQGTGESPDCGAGAVESSYRGEESGSGLERECASGFDQLGESASYCKEGVSETGVWGSGMAVKGERSQEHQVGVYPVSGGRVQADRPNGVADFDCEFFGHSLSGGDSDAPLGGAVLRRGASVPFRSLISTRAEMHTELQRRPISAVVSDWRIKCHWDRVLDKVSELNKRWAQRRGGENQGKRKGGVIAQWWKGVRRIEAHGGKSIWQELTSGSWEVW